MAQPASSQVHVDAILTGISVAYMQDQSVYIADKVFPTVPVDKQSDKYYIFDKNAWFRDEAQKRAPATESAGSGYTLSTTNYYADVWAVHKDIDEQTRKNSDNPLSPDRNATQYVTRMMLLRQEIQWVSDNFTTGVWATDAVGGTDFTVWSNYASSTPIEDMEEAKTAILSVTGFEPNVLVLGYEVFTKLRNHPDIVERYKYTSSQVITEEMLARLFGVDRILVAKAVKATNIEGDTAAYAFTHGKHALLCYAAPEPGIEVPSAGYKFMWKGISDGMGTTVGITKIPIPLRKADRIEAQMAWDNKIVGTDLGYFFSGAVV